MAGEIAVSQDLVGRGDDQLVDIWLHGRSEHTIRAYRVDVARFRLRVGKPPARVALADLQEFADRWKGQIAGLDSSGPFLLPF